MQGGGSWGGGEPGTAAAGGLAAETEDLSRGCQLRYQRNRLEKGSPKTPHSLERVEYSGRYEGLTDRAAIEVRDETAKINENSQNRAPKAEGASGGLKGVGREVREQ